MNKSSGVSEGRLMDVYEELNKTYFENAIHVYRIRTARFLKDLENNGVTYGLFEYSETGSQIFLNRYLLMPWILKKWPWAVEVVVYHELVHAHMLLNLYPHRFGQHFCNSHGPEFWILMLRHPKAMAWERIMKKITPIVQSRIQYAAGLAKHRDPSEWHRISKRRGGFSCHPKVKSA